MIAHSHKQIAGSALAHGAISWKIRPSTHSFSKEILQADFCTQAAAGKFAQLWADRLGRSIAVRRGDGKFSASVPALRG